MVENLFEGALSSYEPRLFLGNYLFGLEFNSVQDDFQHGFARITDEGDSSVVLAEQLLPFSGLCLPFFRSRYRFLLKHQPWSPRQLEQNLLVSIQLCQTSPPLSVMLLQSQLPQEHERLVVDLLLGVDCSTGLHCHHSHSCIQF